MTRQTTRSRRMAAAVIVLLLAIIAAARSDAQSIALPAGRTANPVSMTTSSFPAPGTVTIFSPSGQIQVGSCAVPGDSVTTSTTTSNFTVQSSAAVRLRYRGNFYTENTFVIGQSAYLTLNIVDATHVSVTCTRQASDWVTTTYFSIDDLNGNLVVSIQRGTVVTDGNTGLGSATLSAVTVNKSSVDFLGAKGFSTAQRSNACWQALTSTTNLAVTALTSGGNPITCSYQVINWN